MSYDKRCEDLARVFLNDAGVYDHATEAQLAQDIQDAIEGFLRDIESTRQVLAPFMGGRHGS